MRSYRLSLLSAGLTVAVLQGAPVAARADAIYATLHSFGGGDACGVFPLGGLVEGPGGSFVGANGHCVYQFTPDPTGVGPGTFDSVVTLPQSYTPTGSLAPDGAGGLIGTAGGGQVYRVAPPARAPGAWSFVNIGFAPTVGFIEDGPIYARHATYAANGTGIFRVQQAPANYFTTLLASIPAASGGGFASGHPIARYVDGAFTLFGTTTNNSRPDTAYALTEPVPPSTTWTYRTIASFGAKTTADGLSFALIADKSLHLYGSAIVAPNEAGVFRLTPPANGTGAWGIDILSTFVGYQSYPTAELSEDDSGSLYGTSQAEIFKLTPRDAGGHLTPWNHTALYTFPTDKYPLPDPRARLLLMRETTGALSIYGTTEGGGAHGDGSIFRLRITP